MSGQQRCYTESPPRQPSGDRRGRVSAPTLQGDTTPPPPTAPSVNDSLLTERPFVSVQRLLSVWRPTSLASMPSLGGAEHMRLSRRGGACATPSRLLSRNGVPTTAAVFPSLGQAAREEGIEC